MPGAGGPAGHPAMNPMMPPYLSASQVQAASAAAASGHHSLPPNTHSQPPPPHMQHGGHVSGMPPSVSINQPQMATINAPKPYEKRKRTPLLIVNPETWEVVNLTESKAGGSSISETASEANSEVSEVKAEELASETEAKEEDEVVKEAAVEAAVVPEVNVEAKVEVVSEPSEIHPDSSSIDNDQVLEQTVENNDLEGKSKTKKKDAKVEKEAEKAATPEAKEIEAATGTPQAASSSSKPEPEQPIEVVDGNCVSSKIEQNHVEQNHVGNNKEVEKKVEETVEEVIKTNDDNVAVTDEMTTNDINTEGDEVVLENGTASSSANNSNPASKSSSLIKLKYN